MLLIDEEKRRLIEGGAIILVATSDEARRPFATRGCGAHVVSESPRVTVQVARVDSTRLVADLQKNGRIAVMFGNPMTFRSIQLKGRFVEVATPNEAEIGRATTQSAMLASTLEKLGVAKHLTQALQMILTTDLVAITFDAEECFDQTPGPGAGRKL